MPVNEAICSLIHEIIMPNHCWPRKTRGRRSTTHEATLRSAWRWGRHPRNHSRRSTSDHRVQAWLIRAPLWILGAFKAVFRSASVPEPLAVWRLQESDLRWVLSGPTVWYPRYKSALKDHQVCISCCLEANLVKFITHRRTFQVQLRLNCLT